MSNQQKEHQKSRNEIFGVPLISICLADKANTTNNAIAVDIAFFILLAKHLLKAALIFFFIFQIFICYTICFISFLWLFWICKDTHLFLITNGIMSCWIDVYQKYSM